MDEVVTENSSSELQSDERLKKLEDLEEARLLLFDETYIPDDASRLHRYTHGPRAGQVDLRERAMARLNNLSNYLPGGGRYAETVRGEGTAFSEAFVRDFATVATELGIDLDRVEEMNVSDEHSAHVNTFSDTYGLLELYKYVFPAIEKLVKEKDYPVLY